MCVAVGSGAVPSFQSAVSSMVTIEKSYTPITSHVDRYEKYYRRVYSRLYESIRELNEELALINHEIEESS